jgi:transcriptional regulator with XRE-family HTH domain
MRYQDYMNILSDIGNKIQSIRERKGITQDKLEEKTGINAKYISAIERGQKNLTILTLEKIAKGLEVEPFELMIPPIYLEQEDQVKKAIESLIKDADAKTLNLCLDFLRKGSS